MKMLTEGRQVTLSRDQYKALTTRISESLNFNAFYIREHNDNYTNTLYSVFPIYKSKGPNLILQ